MILCWPLHLLLICFRCARFIHVSSMQQPANLLIFSNGTLRISDFGCAQAFDPKAPMQFSPPESGTSFSSASSLPSSAPSTPALPIPPPSVSPWANGTAGTEPFWPPEVCSGAGGDLRSADLWAIGCCLSCFAFGALPYNPALPTALLMDAIVETLPNLPPPPMQPLGTSSSKGSSDDQFSSGGTRLDCDSRSMEVATSEASNSSNSVYTMKEWWSEPSAMQPEYTPALLNLLLGEDHHDASSSNARCSSSRFTGFLAKDPRQRPSPTVALASLWFKQVAEDMDRPKT